MNIKCPACGNGNTVSDAFYSTCLSCGTWLPEQSRPLDKLGSAALAKCLLDPRRLAVGTDGSGDYRENTATYLSRRAAMSVIPKLSPVMLETLSGLSSIPGESPAVVMGISTSDLAAAWDGRSVKMDGSDSGRVMDDIVRKLVSRGTVQAKDFANLAIIGTSMLSATENCRRWILDGKQHSVIAGRVPGEIQWANMGANPSQAREEEEDVSLVAVIPRWGMPPAIVALEERAGKIGVDTSSSFWAASSVIPSKHSLLADACEPQPVLWSAINANRGWSVARLAWFVSPLMVFTATSSESMDDGTVATICVTREFKGHGSVNMSRSVKWKSLEEASDSVLSVVEKFAAEHMRSGMDFCSDSWTFQMAEPWEVIHKVTDDKTLWSPACVRLLGLGVNRAMIQWCASIR